MPTATSAFQYALHNLGPLTATFTAAPTCATLTNFVHLGLATAPQAAVFRNDCDGSNQRSAAGCLPSGSVLDSQFATALYTKVGNYDLNYFSPGLACPSGWTTAGSAAKGTASDTPIVTSGVFAAPSGFPSGFTVGPNTERAPKVFNPVNNVLMGALDPGETAVACCPEYVFLFFSASGSGETSRTLTLRWQEK
jgi:hypothetical protein